jgi:hypothetical protein
MDYLDFLMADFKKFVQRSGGVGPVPFYHIWQVCDAQ